MNLSLLYNSARHLRSFKLVVSLSTYVNEQITNLVYNDNKLISGFDIKDIDVIKVIIHLTNDTDLLGEYLVEYIVYFDIVEVILERDPSLIHYDYDFAVRLYCEANDLEMCKRIAKYKPNVTAINNYCFKVACNERQNVRLLKWLFKQLTEHETIDTDIFQTETSICGNQFSLMKVIMDYNDRAKLYIPNIELVCSIRDYDEAYNMFVYILNNRSVEISDISDGFRAACRVGNYDLVKFIIDTYDDRLISQDSASVASPLEEACNHSHYRIAKLLIFSSLSTHENLEHLLALAIKCGNYDIVKLLIGCGTDIGSLEVLYEVRDCKHREIKRLCIEHIDKYVEYYRLDDITIDLRR